MGGGFSLALADRQGSRSRPAAACSSAAPSATCSGVARPLLRDPLLAATVSLATSFAAYLAGEEAHVSGVLAVVIAGLLASHDAPRGDSGAGRLQTDAVWRLVDFLLEGLVFLLIGQQLPTVLRGLRDEPAGVTAAAILVTLAAVLLVRPVWLLLTQLVPGRLGWRPGDRSPLLRGREVAALTWAGTRGVITLAAIFSYPAADSTPAARSPTATCCCCARTWWCWSRWSGRALTFAPLLRRLRLRANAAEEAQVRHDARLAAISAAVTAVDDLQARKQVPAEIADNLRGSLRQRADRSRTRMSMLSESDGELTASPELVAAIEAQHAVIAAQRQELLRWRDCGKLPDESLRQLQHELDLQERALPGS